MTMQANSAGNGAQFITKKLQRSFQKATRSQMRYRQFASFSINQGLNKGVEANWVVASKLTPVAPITEGANVPVEDNATVTGSAIVAQYIKGVPFTKKLSMVTEIDMKEMVEENLATAFGESVEIFGCRPAYAQTNIKITPADVGAVLGSSTTDIVVSNTDVAAFSKSNAAALTVAHVLSISIAMQEADVPTRDGKYFAVARPNTFKAFRQDMDQLSKFSSEGFDNIVKGKVAMYDNIVMVAQTAVPSQAWTNAKSDEAFFFGKDSIVEVIVSPEKVIANSSINWGQDLGIGYDALLGHSILRKNRVYHWASAT